MANLNANDMPMGAMGLSLVRIGFTATAAANIVGVAEGQQGMHDVEEYRWLTDKEVESLCQVVRKPGGTLPNNPAALLLEGAPARMTNPGIEIAARAAGNLKLAVYLIGHKARTSRAMLPEDIMLASVRAVKEMRLIEENHKDPTEIPKLTKVDWVKAF